MKEKYETPQTVYIEPNIAEEEGEFMRVAEKFGLDSGALMYLAEENGSLIELTETTWSVLDNTNSFEVRRNDWEQVAHHAVDGHKDAPRDYEKFKGATQLPASIVMKYGDTYHLVAGNTRLMVARSAGLVPRVWLFEAYEN